MEPAHKRYRHTFELPYCVAASILGLLLDPSSDFPPYPYTLSLQKYHLKKWLEHKNLKTYGLVCKQWLLHVQSFMPSLRVYGRLLKSPVETVVYPITRLRIEESLTTYDDRVYFIPSGITALWYHGRSLRQLKFGTPPCITHFTARCTWDETCYEDSNNDMSVSIAVPLLDTLTHLKLCGAEYPGDVSYLPPNLTHFTFEGDSSYVIVSTFPSSLIYLELSSKANIPKQDLNVENLPPSLLGLIIGNNLAQDLLLPPTLLSLTVTNNFSQALPVLPPSLKFLSILSLNYEENPSHYSLLESQLPLLHTLIISERYTYMVQSLPPSLTVLHVPFWSLCSNTFTNSPNLKELWITNCMRHADTQSAPVVFSPSLQLPPNLTHLHLSESFLCISESSFNFPQQLTHLEVNTALYKWNNPNLLPSSLTHLSLTGFT